MAIYGGWVELWKEKKSGRSSSSSSSSFTNPLSSNIRKTGRKARWEEKNFSSFWYQPSARARSKFSISTFSLTFCFLLHAKLRLLAFPSATNALLIGRDSIEELDSPRAVLNLLFFHDLSVYFALRLDPLSPEKSLLWKVGIWSTPYDC